MSQYRVVKRLTKGTLKFVTRNKKYDVRHSLFINMSIRYDDLVVLHFCNARCIEGLTV